MAVTQFHLLMLWFWPLKYDKQSDKLYSNSYAAETLNPGCASESLVELKKQNKLVAGVENYLGYIVGVLAELTIS